jgi:alkylation response protein AidB-like acyl-CoA dehydrogenase
MSGESSIPLGLPESCKDVVSWVHEFAEEQMRPVAALWDEAEEIPWPVIQAAADAGIYDHEFLPTLAGDESGVAMPAVIEELCWGDLGLGLSLLGSSLAATGIYSSGTPEQIAKWVPRCYRDEAGKVALAAFIASEPDAGSDVGSLRTRAVLDESTGEWVLNGTKTWGTNGGAADVHVIVASVDPSLGARGQASFVIPKSSTEGISQGQKFKKMGIRASHTAEVVLTECRIPADNVLGGTDRLMRRLEKARSGEQVRTQAAMATFEASRPMVGAMGVGVARAAHEVALDYAKQRSQFDKLIIENQAIAFKLAKMATSIDAARLLVWRATWMARNNVPFHHAEGSMSKWVASETAVSVTGDAIQILGGNGYTREYPVERMSRDARILTIFEGTSQIQQLVIARAISGVRIR